jgi:glycosyltransferase involved in cell wall biosynthesis
MAKELKENPLVSTVIPTLNERHHLLQLVESIQLQTYRPIEVIFVDGGSSDGSRSLLSSLAAINSDIFLRIAVIYEEDFGDHLSPAHARNIGIKASTGHYLILLDADTKFASKESISKLKSLLDTSPFLRVMARIEVDTALEQQLSYREPHFYHCGYQRWIFDKLLFNENLVFGEDRDLWYRIKRDLGVADYFSEEVLLSRHLPHNEEEYLKQATFYAKSYNKYVENVLKEREFYDISEICDVLLGCIVCVIPPLFFALSIFKDIRGHDKRNLGFTILNLKRRYLFCFNIIKSSLNRKYLSNYIKCFCLFFSMQRQLFEH